MSAHLKFKRVLVKFGLLCMEPNKDTRSKALASKLGEMIVVLVIGVEQVVMVVFHVIFRNGGLVVLNRECTKCCLLWKELAASIISCWWGRSGGKVQRRV